jgi:hypothetical protein
MKDRLMNPEPPRKSMFRTLAIGAAIVVGLAVAAAFLPVFDCPMCGNPNPSALRLCYCNSRGTVSALLLLRWANRKHALLRQMGYCSVCERKLAVARVNTVGQDGSPTRVIACRDCALKLGVSAEKLDPVGQ